MSAATNFVMVGSVFDLPPESIEPFEQKRLYPTDTNQGLWGCSAKDGFLAQGEKLLRCCEIDRKTLTERRVTYDQVADELLRLAKAVDTIGVAQIIDGKFEVTLSHPRLNKQFCPFSITDDSNATFHTGIQGACGDSNQDITITNTSNGKSIKFNALLPHLIKQHHFFGGNVPYRLDPGGVIDTLELQPNADFSSPAPVSPTTMVTQLPPPPPQPKWSFAGKYPIASDRVPDQLSELYKTGLYSLGKDIKGIMLSYPHGFDDQPEMGANPDMIYLHLFNLGTQVIEVNDTIMGEPIKFLIPPRARVSFAAKKEQ